MIQADHIESEDFLSSEDQLIGNINSPRVTSFINQLKEINNTLLIESENSKEDIIPSVINIDVIKRAKLYTNMYYV